jgi:hypothetical protein
MTAQEVSTRAAVTVTEMAALCQLSRSRSRFYTLMQAGAFPPPVQHESTKRPFYLRELIEICLEVRRTSVGVDGRVVLFNRRRADRAAPRPTKHKPTATPQESPYGDLIAGLKALGMSAVDAQVGPVVNQLFPNNLAGVDLGEAIRQVFLALKRQGV